jgi:hypothetical protein
VSTATAAHIQKEWLIADDRTSMTPPANTKRSAALAYRGSTPGGDKDVLDGNKPQ